MPKKHPGFKAVQAQIAHKEGVPMGRAGAILASATRHASVSAKKVNPNLKHVPGNKMGGSLHTPDYAEHREHTERVRSGARGESSC